MPCARNSDSSFQNSRREIGSTPVVGSSSRISVGSWTRVQASASFCFMPPDRRSASRLAERRQLRHRQQLIPATLVVADAVDLGKERDVLVDGQIAIQAESLREVSHSLGDRPMVFHGVEAEHAKLACVGVQKPAHQPDGRRLTCAVRADQPEHLALAHVEAEIGERLGRAVALGDVDEGDGVHWSFNSASTGMPSFRTPARLSTLTLMR